MMIRTNIRINGTIINNIEILRTTNTEVPPGDPDPDLVSTYRWEVRKDDSTDWSAIGWVDHRYGDGPLVLLGKVLDSYNEVHEDPEDEDEEG